MKNLKTLAQWALRALCALLLIVIADQALGADNVAIRLLLAVCLIVVALVGIFADKIIKY